MQALKGLKTAVTSAVISGGGGGGSASNEDVALLRERQSNLNRLQSEIRNLQDEKARIERIVKSSVDTNQKILAANRELEDTLSKVEESKRKRDDLLSELATLDAEKTALIDNKSNDDSDVLAMVPSWGGSIPIDQLPASERADIALMRRRVATCWIIDAVFSARARRNKISKWVLRIVHFSLVLLLVLFFTLPDAATNIGNWSSQYQSRVKPELAVRIVGWTLSACLFLIAIVIEHTNFAHLKQYHKDLAKDAYATAQSFQNDVIEGYKAASRNSVSSWSRLQDALPRISPKERRAAMQKVLSGLIEKKSETGDSSSAAAESGAAAGSSIPKQGIWSSLKKLMSLGLEEVAPSSSGDAGSGISKV